MSAGKKHSEAEDAACGSALLASPLVSAIALLIAAELSTFALLRVAFHAAFRGDAAGAKASEIARAFGLGLRFDLRLALLLAAPLFVLGALAPLHPRRRAGALVWRGWILVAGLAVLLVYAFDFGHYEYLHERLDAAALDELRSPREAFGMLWESYPVLPALLGITAAAFGLHGLGLCAVRRASRPPRPVRRARIAARVACSAAFVLGIYGAISWYPLRWSQAFFGTSPFVSALASNPVLYFYETLKNHGQRPDPEAVRQSYDLLADLLEVEERNPASLAFAREVHPRSPPPFAPNLVVIHMESWAAFQTGMLGNPLPSSPNADALARDSLLFTRFFVPSGPTARSVFSMLTGIPDVPENSPRGSASRDPGSVRQPTLVNALEGYEKHYFLGGSANWANIRALLAGNVQGVVIHDEGSYDGSRVDVWGVSDLTLFEQAVETFDAAAGRPFFAFIQTSGNHKPYTIPADSGGFERTELDGATLHDAGFKSREAYDGFRFLDHALGRFFALARERGWYRDTVFAIYGDHGVPSVNGVPFERIGLVRNHVPFLIHAPRLVPEGRSIDFPASSVDVLPTCLGLMGIPYVNTALGRDALAERAPERRFAFLSNGLIQGEWFWRSERDGRTGLHRYASDAAEADWSEREPELCARLAAVHEALRQWALWSQHSGPPPAAAAPSASFANGHSLGSRRWYARK